MPVAEANGISLFYETFGDSDRPAILLIMGLAAQMTGWDERFCRLLADQGYFVIRFDNRDVGLSSRATQQYQLDDLALDALGLLDVLKINEAHIVGASMGGMIAQLIAVDHPERVLSLTSIMSTTGNPSVGQPHPETLATFGQPPAETDEGRIEQMVEVWKVLGSPAYPLSQRQIRAMVERDYRRSHDPEGASRQFAAVMLAADRTLRLNEIKAPTLIIHGSDDPLINVSGGKATAAAIPEAELMVIEGMGHDLPYPKWSDIVDAIVKNARRKIPS